MSGLLGKAALVADTNTVLYTVPADTVTTLSVLVVNKASDEVKVCVAVGVGSSPLDEDYIEFDVSLPQNGVLERTSIVCSSGEQIILRANSSGCSVRVNGFEQGV